MLIIFFFFSSRPVRKTHTREASGEHAAAHHDQGSHADDTREAGGLMGRTGECVCVSLSSLSLFLSLLSLSHSSFSRFSLVRSLNRRDVATTAPRKAHARTSSSITVAVLQIDAQDAPVAREEVANVAFAKVVRDAANVDSESHVLNQKSDLSEERRLQTDQ